jgi:MscS family membrane protein
MYPRSHLNVREISMNNLIRATVLSLFFLLCPLVSSQVPGPKPAATQEPPGPPEDAIGRSTPRGTVVGFLNASRKDEMDIAALYLDTPQHGTEATALARQLAAALNRYLPARLNEISDKPEGSVQDPRRPNEELIGSIKATNAELDIVIERVNRGKEGQIWLFSSHTLDELPAFSRASNIHTAETHLPKFLVTTRVLTIPLFEWLAILCGLPLVYFLTGLLNRLLSWSVGQLRRRIWRTADLQDQPSVLPIPIRLLLVALFIRWMLSIVELPLLARQVWSTIILLFTITAGIWMILLLSGWAERFFVKRRRQMSGSASVLRLFRRLIDALALFGGVLFTLHYFGVNITAALAGLGVGGIAIALAAQKTLENVVAGVSLIADQAVRVGDFVNLGDVQGTVVELGLRSTRILTVDRTLVSLPNGQMATMKLETLSTRDKFLLRQLISLQYETTQAQLLSVMDGIRDLMSSHAAVDSTSLRVRFIRFGPSALEIEVFTYVFARDWNNFLEIQEELLLKIRDVIERTGTGIAIPSQRLYVSADLPSQAIAQGSKASEISSVPNARLMHSRHL